MVSSSGTATVPALEERISSRSLSAESYCAARLTESREPRLSSNALTSALGFADLSICIAALVLASEAGAHVYLRASTGEILDGF